MIAGEAMNPLDSRIVDAFSVVSLLLAIAAAYLAAIWPIVDDLLNGPIPDVAIDRRRTAERCRAYANTAAVLAGINLAICGIMAPLAIESATQVIEAGRLHVPRAAAVLAVLLLLSAAVVAAALAIRLRRHWRSLAPDAAPRANPHA